MPYLVCRELFDRAVVLIALIFAVSPLSVWPLSVPTTFLLGCVYSSSMLQQYIQLVNQTRNKKAERAAATTAEY